MIPTEFKKLKDLRKVDDKGLRPEMLLLLESGDESVSAFLSQIKSWVLSEIIESLTPVGAPIFWPNDQIPQGYAKINDGLDFNVIQYPLLALAWPSGEIPPHKGLVIECTADGATAGNVETGEVKSHAHTAKNKSISLSGKFKSDSASVIGSATVDLPVRSGDDASQTTTPAWCGDAINNGNRSTATINTSNLSVSTETNVSFSDVNVTPEISSTGATRNTVDRINYNVIVRLA